MKSIKLSLAIGALCATAASGDAVAQHHVVPPDHCHHAQAAHIICIINITDDAHWKTSTTFTVPNPVMPWQGNTPATIEAQFPTVIEWAWSVNSAASLNARMTTIPDIELAHFSHHYWVETNGQMTPLLMLAAQKLTAANLVKLQAAFGAAATDPEVATYAPPAIHAAYMAAAKRVPIKQSHAAYVQSAKVSRTINAMPGGLPAPNVWMTPTEIFEEYLWTGAETEAEAAFMTAKFMGGPALKAATWGYSIGSAYYQFGISIDPEFAINVVTLMGDAYSSDFGPINTVSGYGYIDGPITEVPGSGGGADVAVYQAD